jgi:hypothetical protein
MSFSLGLVIPVFRPDVDRLKRYIWELNSHLNPDTIRLELDDPSEDVIDAVRDLPATFHSVPRRRGKGAAITSGFEALDTKVYAFVDADGATPVDSFKDVLDPVFTEDADLSVGSRRHPQASVADHQTVVRRFLGDRFVRMARWLLDANLFDYQCGAKAITSGCWSEIKEFLREPGFAWDIELIAVAAARGATITEIPVVWKDQPGSTVDPVRDTFRMFRGLIAARHRAKVASESSIHITLDNLGVDPAPPLVNRTL